MTGLVVGVPSGCDPHLMLGYLAGAISASLVFCDDENSEPLKSLYKSLLGVRREIDRRRSNRHHCAVGHFQPVSGCCWCYIMEDGCDA